MASFPCPPLELNAVIKPEQVYRAIGVYTEQIFTVATVEGKI